MGVALGSIKQSHHERSITFTERCAQSDIPSCHRSYWGLSLERGLRREEHCCRASQRSHERASQWYHSLSPRPSRLSAPILIYRAEPHFADDLQAWPMQRALP